MAMKDEIRDLREAYVAECARKSIDDPQATYFYRLLAMFDDLVSYIAASTAPLPGASEGRRPGTPTNLPPIELGKKR